MYFYVYVIYSDQSNLFYKGSTSDIEKRMFEHNNDLERYTARKGPWKLVVLERYDSKGAAPIREKALKKCKAEYFHWLSMQPQNLAKHYR
jgi:putative endonuclease